MKRADKSGSQLNLTLGPALQGFLFSLLIGVLRRSVRRGLSRAFSERRRCSIAGHACIFPPLIRRQVHGGLGNRGASIFVVAPRAEPTLGIDDCSTNE